MKPFWEGAYGQESQWKIPKDCNTLLRDRNSPPQSDCKAHIFVLSKSSMWHLKEKKIMTTLDLHFNGKI